MTETFREFFTRRNGIPFPAVAYEESSVVNNRLANTLADWADALAAKSNTPAKVAAEKKLLEWFTEWAPPLGFTIILIVIIAFVEITIRLYLRAFFSA